MTALLLTLFAASGLVAVIAMASSWRRYGRSALALRGELAACAQWNTYDVRISEVIVRSSATILRPDFTARRPAGERALPAAA